MGITQITPDAEIDAYIANQIEIIINETIRRFQEVGERCLNAAKENGNYTDRSKNLRSSVGYVISVDGKIVYQSSFEVMGTDPTGAKSGIQFAKEIVRQFPEGIVLIVVAGMNYAQYVSAKGYDVIDSAELLADRLVPQILKQLGFK